MVTITRSEFEKLPRDYKEPWHDYWGDHPEWLGRWTAFLPGHGTTLYKLEESAEITRASVNSLLEWADHVSNAISFPLPKVE